MVVRIASKASGREKVMRRGRVMMWSEGIVAVLVVGQLSRGNRA